MATVVFGKLEIIADGNSGIDQDKNWRWRVDSNGDFFTEGRSGGAWDEYDRQYYS